MIPLQMGATAALRRAGFSGQPAAGTPTQTEGTKTVFAMLIPLLP